jgi:hypothetical protein
MKNRVVDKEGDIHPNFISVSSVRIASPVNSDINKLIHLPGMKEKFLQAVPPSSVCTIAACIYARGFIECHLCIAETLVVFTFENGLQIRDSCKRYIAEDLLRSLRKIDYCNLQRRIDPAIPSLRERIKSDTHNIP